MDLRIAKQLTGHLISSFFLLIQLCYYCFFFPGQDLSRPPYSLAGLGHPPPHHPSQMDPLMSYRLGMYPPGSRERLELELERDKRERDAREREMRERELRDLELREKMKQDMELKPGMCCT